MLQQTQVDRVLPKYSQFTAKFPDFRSLADTPLNVLFSMWHGLGYNRRCLRMKESAKIITNKFENQLPDSVQALKGLPGIGEATSRALFTFCFNKPAVFIETNIRQVFLHFFFRHREKVQDNEILPLVEATLDRENPREWYYALMDYGAMLKREIGNLGIKSTHYRKSPPFEGSIRQIRGSVLKSLIENPLLSENDLINTIQKDPSMIKEVLHKLETEAFIEKRGSFYSIA